MKLLLDENIPLDILARLAGHKISVRHILLLPKLSASNDEVVFSYAFKNRLTIITYDNDFLNDHFLNQPHYGIIFIRTRNKNFNILSNSIWGIVRQFKSLKNKIIIIDN